MRLRVLQIIELFRLELTPTASESSVAHFDQVLLHLQPEAADKRDYGQIAQNPRNWAEDKNTIDISIFLYYITRQSPLKM